MNKKVFNQKKRYLILLLLVGVFLLIVSNGFSNENEKNDSDQSLQEYELCEKRCEERIALILKQFSEIESSSVMVTLDEIPSNKERPHVRGVAVVCQGRESPDLQLQIVMLISSSLGITSDKIYVTFTQ